MHEHFSRSQSWFVPLLQIRPSFAFDKSSLRLTKPCCIPHKYYLQHPSIVLIIISLSPMDVIVCRLRTEPINGLQTFIQLRLLQLVSRHNILLVYCFLVCLFVCNWVWAPGLQRFAGIRLLQLVHDPGAIFPDPPAISSTIICHNLGKHLR